MSDRKDTSPADKTSPFLTAIITGGLAGLLGDFLSRLFLDHPDRSAGSAGVIVFFAAGVLASVYYWMILGYGGCEDGSLQRHRYDALRAGLRSGGSIGPVYEKMLRSTLAAVDRFFGDDLKDQPRLRAAFSLAEPAPLWTASSFDRCLLIALVYPLAVLFSLWLVTGAVGPAEAALGLRAGAPDWQRWLELGLCALFLWAIYARLDCLPQVIVMALLAAAIVVVGSGSLGGLGSLTIGLVTLAVAVPLVIANILAGMIALRLNAEYLALKGKGPVDPNQLTRYRDILPVTCMGAGVLALAIALAVICLAGSGWLALLLMLLILLLGLVTLALRAWRPALLLLLFSVGAFLALGLATAAGAGDFSRPLMLFVGLLTLVNAPFDWLTLGLTRALLRRGLERGGWWPLFYGLIDLVLAMAVVAALAVAVLWTVQLHGHLTRLAGASPVVEARHLLDAVAEPGKRGAPELWWLYAMLFATLIPSIVNVALGALSLLRGIPGLATSLANRMPLGAPVIDSERMWMAPALALQAVLSVAAGALVMLGLVWAILEWIVPTGGISLTEMLRSLAELDLPGRLLALVGLD